MIYQKKDHNSCGSQQNHHSENEVNKNNNNKSTTQPNHKVLTDFSIETIMRPHSRNSPFVRSTPIPELRGSHDDDSYTSETCSDPDTNHNEEVTPCTPVIGKRKYKPRRRPSISSSTPKPKPFKCDQCIMSFANAAQLRNHVRIHTGERPFHCNFEGCGKCFTRNEELTRHKLIHTGLKEHECSTCGKKFGRKDHLKKHLKVHEEGRQRKRRTTKKKKLQLELKKELESSLDESSPQKQVDQSQSTEYHNNTITSNPTTPEARINPLPLPSPSKSVEQPKMDTDTSEIQPQFDYEDSYDSPPQVTTKSEVNQSEAYRAYLENYFTHMRWFYLLNYDHMDSVPRIPDEKLKGLFQYNA